MDPKQSSLSQSKDGTKIDPQEQVGIDDTPKRGLARIRRRWRFYLASYSASKLESVQLEGGEAKNYFTALLAGSGGAHLFSNEELLDGYNLRSIPSNSREDQKWKSLSLVVVLNSVLCRIFMCSNRRIAFFFSLASRTRWFKHRVVEMGAICATVINHMGVKSSTQQRNSRTPKQSRL